MPPSDKFEMPETFSFGLEERAPGEEPIKLKVDDDSGCQHLWFPAVSAKQTLRHEGKTVLECRQCERIVAIYDWKLEALKG